KQHNPEQQQRNGGQCERTQLFHDIPPLMQFGQPSSPGAASQVPSGICSGPRVPSPARPTFPSALPAAFLPRCPCPSVLPWHLTRTISGRGERTRANGPLGRVVRRRQDPPTH